MVARIFKTREGKKVFLSSEKDVIDFIAQELGDDIARALYDYMDENDDFMQELIDENENLRKQLAMVSRFVVQAKEIGA